VGKLLWADSCGKAESCLAETSVNRGILWEMSVLPLRLYKTIYMLINCSCVHYSKLRSWLHQIQHQSSTCPLRLIVCRFCGDTVHAGGEPVDARDRLRNMYEHESICGSRMAPCDSCGRSVMLKEMDIHLIAVHQKSWSPSGPGVTWAETVAYSKLRIVKGFGQTWSNAQKTTWKIIKTIKCKWTQTDRLLGTSLAPINIKLNPLILIP
jgi:hypothetical protein